MHIGDINTSAKRLFFLLLYNITKAGNAKRLFFFLKRLGVTGFCTLMYLPLRRSVRAPASALTNVSFSFGPRINRIVKDSPDLF